jgi:hypothetical protein
MILGVVVVEVVGREVVVRVGVVVGGNLGRGGLERVISEYPTAFGLVKISEQVSLTVDTTAFGPLWQGGSPLSQSSDKTDAQYLTTRSHPSQWLRDVAC